jgi:hypothetical protein
MLLLVTMKYSQETINILSLSKFLEFIDKDASQYRSWWNNISNEWKY